MRYTAGRRVAIILANNLSRGFVVGSLLAGGVLFLCAVAFWLSEAGRNPEVENLGHGLLWVMRTLLQQEPPYEPATGLGQFLYFVVVVTGVGIIAIVTAGIASKIIQWVMRKDAGMGHATYRDHIVICGWSPKGHEILRELHSEEVVDKRPVAIVADLDHNPTEDDLTTFIRGSTSDSAALLRANIDDAETAIILADESHKGMGPDERDAMTLLTALAVESINPKVHTCVEVIRSENLPHFERAKVDEVVVSAELTGNLLASSAVTHGLSQVVADLTGHAEGNEFYSVEAPAAMAGRTFSSALEQLKADADALLIGLASNGFAYDLNPPADRTIQAGDRLLVIAKADPSPRLTG
jgi:voltage-gated potassium channel